MGVSHSITPKSSLSSLSSLQSYMEQHKGTDPVQAEAYVRAFTDLQTHLAELTAKQQGDQSAGRISSASVDAFVEELLADPEINVHGLPDFAERALYRKVLKIMLGALGHIADTTKIELIGHTISLNIQPIAAAPAAAQVPAPAPAPAPRQPTVPLLEPVSEQPEP